MGWREAAADSVQQSNHRRAQRSKLGLPKPPESALQSAQAERAATSANSIATILFALARPRCAFSRNFRVSGARSVETGRNQPSDPASRPPGPEQPDADGLLQLQHQDQPNRRGGGDQHIGPVD